MKDERFLKPLLIAYTDGRPWRAAFRWRNKLTACKTRSMKSFLKRAWIRDYRGEQQNVSVVDLGGNPEIFELSD